MKSSKWLGVIALTGFLAGCNPLALVQPQVLDQNPMGLDQAAIASDALKILAVGADLNFVAPAFQDIDKNSLPLGGSAGADTIVASIKIKKVQVTDCLTPPNTFNVQLKGVKVMVRNASAQTGPTALQNPDPVTGAASGKTAFLGGFEYTLDSTKEISFTFGRDLYDTVTSGGDNIASIEGLVEADQNTLAGCRLVAIVDDHTVTLSNFR
ncbi:hypothetical protein [Deinococcus cellulosilyticus]|uniref:Uncharacterized protein n=1 Tax=Deinococcus cellulosilyticus (strain DSM 18568 / NBRC 106333 / KACC 11606 / 5516J-15) TaxID=1223518 RepID=A0A511N879_DEIC1|nr:hypothetical protein [Deinococcus cellulosilyticus]GEM49049.1 hypothetical protein DC3_46840 [Deinococcus cellulosilyticus NBRC 106333 = KACC 11606]